MKSPASSRCRRRSGPSRPLSRAREQRSSDPAASASRGGRRTGGSPADGVRWRSACGAAGEPPARARRLPASPRGGLVRAARLALAAARALGDRPEALLDPSCACGPTARHATTWAGSRCARRAAGRQPRPCADLLRPAAALGRMVVDRAGAPDSNDTAAAIEALRAAGVTGKPIARPRFPPRAANATAASRYVAAAAPTPSPPRGRSRRSSQRERSRRRPRSASSVGCAGPTEATATRRATR